MSRDCGDCTSCCDGTLSGEAFGLPIYSGSPCSAVLLNRGCTRYNDRPKMCSDFSCAWRSDDSYPAWMRPDSCNAIGIVKGVDGIAYAELVESSYAKVGTAAVLQFIQWAYGRFGNVRVSVNGGWHYFGTEEFCEAMSRA